MWCFCSVRNCVKENVKCIRSFHIMFLSVRTTSYAFSFMKNEIIRAYPIIYSLHFGKNNTCVLINSIFCHKTIWLSIRILLEYILRLKLFFYDSSPNVHTDDNEKRSQRLETIPGTCLNYNKRFPRSRRVTCFHAAKTTYLPSLGLFNNPFFVKGRLSFDICIRI